jgi:hypothetical protein
VVNVTFPEVNFLVLIKNSGRDEIRRTSHRIKKVEIGQIDIVWTHNKAGSGDYNWCSADVNILDALTPPGGTPNPDDVPVRKRVPVRQQMVGNKNGCPWTPRVGELCLISFNENDQPFIEGTLHQQGMPPVCRSSAHPNGMTLPNDKNSGPYEDRASGYYDICIKKTQFLPLTRRPEGYYDTFPDGAGILRPVCLKYFDKTRDTMFVFECKKGKDAPDCNLCVLNGDGSGEGPDYIKCESGCADASPAANIWLKFLGNDYEGTDDIKLRTKYHHSCGSLLCFDGLTTGYNEGRIWLEAMKGHVHRSHIHFRAQGAATGANLSLRSDYTNAAHIELFGVGDPKKGRIWLSNEDIGNYIDIEEIDEIKVHAALIVLDGDVEITGNLVIDGNNTIQGKCTHGSCSCPCGGGCGESPVVPALTLKDMANLAKAAIAQDATDTACTNAIQRGCTSGGQAVTSGGGCCGGSSGSPSMDAAIDSLCTSGGQMVISGGGCCSSSTPNGITGMEPNASDLAALDAMMTCCSGEVVTSGNDWLGCV